MSLDISLVIKTRNSKIRVYEDNITSNLVRMADAAGLYNAIWQTSDNNGVTTAEQLTPMLRRAIDDMMENPEHYEVYDNKNGWGTYKDFLPWLKKLLSACKEFPEAQIQSLS